MKTKLKDIAQKSMVDLTEKKITRKQAIKKSALMAVSAATMMMLLGNNAQGATTSTPGGDPGGDWN